MQGFDEETDKYISVTERYQESPRIKKRRGTKNPSPINLLKMQAKKNYFKKSNEDSFSSEQLEDMDDLNLSAEEFVNYNSDEDNNIDDLKKNMELNYASLKTAYESNDRNGRRNTTKFVHVIKNNENKYKLELSNKELFDANKHLMITKMTKNSKTSVHMSNDECEIDL